MRGRDRSRICSTICALLHDTVEDTGYNPGRCAKEFSNEIAKIVDGLTKIFLLVLDNSSQQVEFKRYCLHSLPDDLWLSSSLERQAAQTCEPWHEKEKQLKISSETVYVYAPPAHRMGLYNIKTEMEDLAMKYMELTYFRYIAQKLQDTKRESTQDINDFIKPLKEKLRKPGWFWNLRVAQKHSPIWNKNKKKGVAFEEVYIFAIRIIVNSAPKKKGRLLKSGSIITDAYNPSNVCETGWANLVKGYGTATVMGPQGKWVEADSHPPHEMKDRGKGVGGPPAKEGKEDESRLTNGFTRSREALNQESNRWIFCRF